MENSALTPKYRLLLVEDSRREYDALRAEMEQNNWQVMRAVDVDDAPYQLDLAERQGITIDAMAIDLGLPPAPDEPEKSGLPLIQKIRQQRRSLPILAYTTLPARLFSVEKVARKLLTLNVSFAFIKFTGETDSFARLLELTRLGYVILSKDVANLLPYAIADRPDPLDADHWSVLKYLSMDYTHDEIAQKLNIAKGTVANRLERIRELLTEAYPTEDFTNADDLSRWYNTHKVRYCRE